MEKHQKIAALFVASLKSLTLIHQQSHWLSCGDDFYGNHLMFQRLYEGASEDLDSAAEKFIGIYGEECLDFALQAEMLSKLLTRYSKEKDLMKRSILAESEFLKLSQQAYKTFKDLNKMTLGLDDMIMSVSSNREEAMYLLQQTIGKTADNNSLSIKRWAQRALEIVPLSEDSKLAPLASKLHTYRKEMLQEAGIGGMSEVQISNLDTEDLSKKIDFIFTFDHKINPIFKKKLQAAFDSRKAMIQKEAMQVGKLKSAIVTIQIVEN